MKFYVFLEEMNVAVIATADEEQPTSCTSYPILVLQTKRRVLYDKSKTNFYKQLQNNQKVAITAMKSEDYLIQGIRIEGVVKKLVVNVLKKCLKITHS